MNRMALKADLERDEGMRLFPYRDTVGKMTIGVGRNITDRGISATEAYAMLDNDISMAEIDLDRNYPWWRALPEPAQRALANMAFNLGIGRLSKFQGMLSALKAGDYQGAANEALDSSWAQQVKERAMRIADLYREAGENV